MSGEAPGRESTLDLPGTRVRSAALVAGMALGSVVLWFGIPALWVLVAAQLSTPGSPSFGPIMLVLLATPATMVAFAPLLGRLDRAHRRLRGTVRQGPRRAAWNRSMRDARTASADHGVLELVMIVSVGIVVVAAGLWIALAGSMTLPGG